MSEERYILDNEDRAFFQSHYTAIAEKLMNKRLWRGPWSVEVNGCVYKFKVEGYAKKHSPVWEEQQKEIQDAQK